MTRGHARQPLPDGSWLDRVAHLAQGQTARSRYKTDWLLAMTAGGEDGPAILTLPLNWRNT